MLITLRRNYMKVNKIAILGGGSAGWMMATALVKHCPDIKVDIIASEELNPIGVGEATTPPVTKFINEYLGFDETDWMPECDATYKSTIRFNNFSGENETVYHAFSSDIIHNEKDASPWLIKKSIKPETPISDYYATYYKAYHYSEQNKFGKITGSYAHHLDAIKFGQYCKKYCLDYKNLNYINAIVEQITKTNDGDIKSLILDNGDIIKADIFVDCSGFSSMLIDKTLNTPYISFSDYLINDKAIVAKIPHNNPEIDINPYTDCTALSSGWVWNIPLWERTGVGYVYSSKFLSEKEATEEFKEYLKDRFEEVTLEDIEFETINFKTGVYESPWNNNCLALILAAGFIEPLESSGLAIMVIQIKKFIKALKEHNYNYTLLTKNAYNEFIFEIIEEIMHFVSLHYVNSYRTDSPYWNYIHKLKIPKKVIKTLDDLKTNRRNISHIMREYNVYTYKSWESIIVGFNLVPSLYNIRNYNITKEDFNIMNIDKVLNEHKEYLRNEVSNEPSAYQYLKENIYESSSN